MKRQFDIKQTPVSIGRKVGERVAANQRLKRVPGIQHAGKAGGVFGKFAGMGMHAVAKKHAPELVEKSNRPMAVKAARVAHRFIDGRSTTQIGQNFGEKAGKFLGGFLGNFTPAGFLGGMAGGEAGGKIGAVIGKHAGHLVGGIIRKKNYDYDKPHYGVISSRSRIPSSHRITSSRRVPSAGRIVSGSRFPSSRRFSVPTTIRR